MNVIKNGTCLMRKATIFWNIPFTSFFNHLNGRITSRKMGPSRVLLDEEDLVIVAWILSM